MIPWICVYPTAAVVLFQHNHNKYHNKSTINQIMSSHQSPSRRHQKHQHKRQLSKTARTTLPTYPTTNHQTLTKWACWHHQWSNGQQCSTASTNTTTPITSTAQLIAACLCNISSAQKCRWWWFVFPYSWVATPAQPAVQQFTVSLLLVVADIQNG